MVVNAECGSQQTVDFVVGLSESTVEIIHLCLHHCEVGLPLLPSLLASDRLPSARAACAAWRSAALRACATRLLAAWCSLTAARSCRAVSAAAARL